VGREVNVVFLENTFMQYTELDYLTMIYAGVGRAHNASREAARRGLGITLKRWTSLKKHSLISKRNNTIILYSTVKMLCSASYIIVLQYSNQVHCAASRRTLVVGGGEGEGAYRLE